MVDNTDILERLERMENKIENQNKAIRDLIDIINGYSYKVQEAGLYNKRIVEEKAGIKSRDIDIEKIYLLTKQGVSITRQAAMLGCSVTTITNYRKRLKEQGRLG